MIVQNHRNKAGIRIDTKHFCLQFKKIWRTGAMYRSLKGCFPL